MTMQHVPLYARMRPYNPKRGQPHKDMIIAPAGGMLFEAGKWIRIPRNSQLIEYLKDQYPQDDPERLPLFQIGEESEVRAIMKAEKEKKIADRRRQSMSNSRNFYAGNESPFKDLQFEKQVVEEHWEDMETEPVVDPLAEQEADSEEASTPEDDKAWDLIQNQMIEEQLKRDEVEDGSEEEQLPELDEVPEKAKAKEQVEAKTDESVEGLEATEEVKHEVPQQVHQSRGRRRKRG